MECVELAPAFAAGDRVRPPDTFNRTPVAELRPETERPGFFTRAFEQSLAFSTTAYGASWCKMGGPASALVQVGAVLATKGLGP